MKPKKIKKNRKINWRNSHFHLNVSGGHNSPLVNMLQLQSEEMIRFYTNGNVGLGIPIPDAMLHIFSPQVADVMLNISTSS